MIKVLLCIGTRPNFIKVTRFREVAMKYSDVDLKIVHTGQHFDDKMADVFFDQFKLKPDYFLHVGSGSAVLQMAETMTRLENIIKDFDPALIIVVGDVTSTLSCALTANKMGVKLAHVESGLRSFDNEMPEEINRILTDKITDYFFVTEQSGIDNLRNEGIKDEKIFFVGNTMIDTLIKFSKPIDESPVLEKYNLISKKFALLTFHRPGNVDQIDQLTKVVDLLSVLSEKVFLVFPIHPRTKNNLEKYKLLDRIESLKNLLLIEPQDYFSFQKLLKNSAFVLTDSGGVQEETTFLKVPCITIRPNTERPVTISVGSNVLMDFDIEKIVSKTDEILDDKIKKSQIPPLWDGKSTERIMEQIVKLIK